MALSIRPFPPQTRRLTLVHSRSSITSRVRPVGTELDELDRSNASHREAADGDVIQRTPEPECTAGSETAAGSEIAADFELTPFDDEGLATQGSSPRSSSRPSEVQGLADGELVALTRIGESAAFEQLYRRHAPYALALAVRVQGHSGDVEDIVHDAFIRVHGRLSELRADASFKPWLSSIVVSLVRTRLRKRRLLSALGLLPVEPVELDALVHSDAGPEVRAQLAQVYSVLNGVPIDQRICWALRYLEGRKLEEVAVLAGCSLATAKRRIAQVQERLWQREGHGSSDHRELEDLS